MSFDLYVELNELPGDLLRRWEQALAGQGILAQICPDADLATHSGYLPIKVDWIPRELLGAELTAPITAGFEFSHDDEVAVYDDELHAEDREHFRGEARFITPASRTLPEVTMQCLCAAWLTEFADGRYVDPQSGLDVGRGQAMQAALDEIGRHVTEAAGTEAADVMRHLFPGWQALGVSVT
ncbi:MAG: hypothetical protein IPJ14_07705 [Kineosporiaceae bacterium]|nr:hypothetical protein [Kineosporiaceae bacterium]